ncbi:hypothetical protein CDCA_CDCA10G3056 [Cyanidium caldarium]|uniref:Uncharacterized protein n=1 Tax=Cyanidium caldarium TaxID=2771 RepID=A0AAV9IY28_CYACA|nr:hypothetical protein CDCA_CDCA10G3056 [Cyanidium caldarium]
MPVPVWLTWGGALAVASALSPGMPDGRRSKAGSRVRSASLPEERTERVAEPIRQQEDRQVALGVTDVAGRRGVYDVRARFAEGDVPTAKPLSVEEVLERERQRNLELGARVGQSWTRPMNGSAGGSAVFGMSNRASTATQGRCERSPVGEKCVASNAVAERWGETAASAEMPPSQPSPPAAGNVSAQQSPHSPPSGSHSHLEPGLRELLRIRGENRRLREELLEASRKELELGGLIEAYQQRSSALEKEIVRLQQERFAAAETRLWGEDAGEAHPQETPAGECFSNEETRWQERDQHNAAAVRERQDDCLSVDDTDESDNSARVRHQESGSVPSPPTHLHERVTAATLSGSRFATPRDQLRTCRPTQTLVSAVAPHSQTLSSSGASQRTPVRAPRKPVRSDSSDSLGRMIFDELRDAGSVATVLARTLDQVLQASPSSPSVTVSTPPSAGGQRARTPRSPASMERHPRRRGRTAAGRLEVSPGAQCVDTPLPVVSPAVLAELDAAREENEQLRRKLSEFVVHSEKQQHRRRTRLAEEMADADAQWHGRQRPGSVRVRASACVSDASPEWADVHSSGERAASLAPAAVNDHKRQHSSADSWGAFWSEATSPLPPGYVAGHSSVPPPPGGKRVRFQAALSPAPRSGARASMPHRVDGKPPLAPMPSISSAASDQGRRWRSVAAPANVPKPPCVHPAL